MRTYTFRTQTLVRAPVSDVFDFFSRAENLERLTPQFLKFTILTPLPIEMRPGALIEYRIRLFGIPLRWRTEITEWEPGRRFVDTQQSGPYRKWVHEHRFEETDAGTAMEDVVTYEVPGSILAPALHRLFVRRRIEEIFRYRRLAILEIFSGSQDAADEPVAMTLEKDGAISSSKVE